MEIPVDLGMANRYLDASEAIRFQCESKSGASRVIQHLGKSRRLALTTAKSGPNGKSRGGCIVMHSPWCEAEARRWIRKRGFDERLDGFGRMGDSLYIARRELKSCRAPSFDIGERQKRSKHV